MAVYEYSCECGLEFERMKTMRDRYNVSCPSCGKTPKLKVSLSNFRVCIPLRVVDGDGVVIGERFDHSPMPTTPPARMI